MIVTLSVDTLNQCRHLLENRAGLINSIMRKDVVKTCDMDWKSLAHTTTYTNGIKIIRMVVKVGIPFKEIRTFPTAYTLDMKTIVYLPNKDWGIGFNRYKNFKDYLKSNFLREKVGSVEADCSGENYFDNDDGCFVHFVKNKVRPFDHEVEKTIYKVNGFISTNPAF